MFCSSFQIPVKRKLQKLRKFVYKIKYKMFHTSHTEQTEPSDIGINSSNNGYNDLENGYNGYAIGWEITPDMDLVRFDEHGYRIGYKPTKSIQQEEKLYPSANDRAIVALCDPQFIDVLSPTFIKHKQPLNNSLKNPLNNQFILVAILRTTGVVIWGIAIYYIGLVIYFR